MIEAVSTQGILVVEAEGVNRIIDPVLEVGIMREDKQVLEQMWSMIRT